MQLHKKGKVDRTPMLITDFFTEIHNRNVHLTEMFTHTNASLNVNISGSAEKKSADTQMTTCRIQSV